MQALSELRLTCKRLLIPFTTAKIACGQAQAEPNASSIYLLLLCNLYPLQLFLILAPHTLPLSYYRLFLSCALAWQFQACLLRSQAESGTPATKLRLSQADLLSCFSHPVG
jgi:hypothetical protein